MKTKLARLSVTDGAEAPQHGAHLQKESVFVGCAFCPAACLTLIHFLRLFYTLHMCWHRGLSQAPGHDADPISKPQSQLQQSPLIREDDSRL